MNTSKARLLTMADKQFATIMAYRQMRQSGEQKTEILQNESVYAFCC